MKKSFIPFCFVPAAAQQGEVLTLTARSRWAVRTAETLQIALPAPKQAPAGEGPPL
jgi:hypothetical protein